MDADVSQRARLARMNPAAAPPARRPAPEIRPDLMRRITARDARDAGAWRAPIRSLLRGGQFGEASAALVAALGAIQADATADAPIADLQTLALAHFAEFSGESRAAAELYTALSPYDPLRLPARLGLGRVLPSLGRMTEAVAALEQATRLQPASTEAWCNLSALHTAEGRAEEALVDAARALELRPDLAAAEMNRGDAFRHLGRFAEAAGAYERALELQPNAPASLNSLAGVARILRQFDRAETLLKRAIDAAPQFELARVNLGTLCVERGRFAEGTELLNAALRFPRLDATARAEVEGALGMVAEHERLAPAIREAVAAGDPQPIRAALDGREGAAVRVPASGVLATLTEFAARVASHSVDVPTFMREGALPPEWPGIEAHFAFHRPETSDGLQRTLDELAAGGPNEETGRRSTTNHDIIRFERAVRARQANSGDAPEGTEAQLRYWHALITWHRPEVFPGQMKPVPTLVLTSPRLLRAAPREAAASCAEFFATQYRLLPPGFARAVFVYFAIVQIHPFYDGNGRVARFMMNAELERAGLCPIVMPQSIAKAMPEVLRQARKDVDLRPLLFAMAEAAELTSAIVARHSSVAQDPLGL
jgi:tetratricopeptide (TPR) repeat protein